MGENMKFCLGKDILPKYIEISRKKLFFAKPNALKINFTEK
jgi:hypothetical protein